MIKLVVVAIIMSILFTSYRGGWGASYPLTRDMSYFDMFYAYQNADAITTSGSNTKRLILTGLISYDAEDLTVKLASYKFFTGWGSLHPTIIGWALIDLGKSCFWLLAVYIGCFLGFCDRLRYSLPRKYNFFFLAFIFMFCAVAVRGSVQYAYSGIIYPFLMLTIYYIYNMVKIKKQ